MNHPHPQWFGSDLNCSICNPICWENHGFGKGMEFKACDNPKCPNIVSINIIDKEGLSNVLDKLWAEWKSMNHFCKPYNITDLPEDQQRCYCNNLWFFMYLKKCLLEEFTV